jgi:hypothetical protein
LNEKKILSWKCKRGDVLKISPYLTLNYSIGYKVFGVSQSFVSNEFGHCYRAKSMETSAAVTPYELTNSDTEPFSPKVGYSDVPELV